MFTRFKKYFLFVLAASFSCDLFAFENRTYQEVLKNEYPNCSLKKENVFLTKVQEKKINSKLENKSSSLILRYANACNKSFVYIDSHNVRTLNETVLIEVKEEEVINLKITSFMEPREYLPPTKWLELLLKKKEEVDSLTGATLSQNAIKRTFKKYLLIDRVLNDK